MERPQCLLPLRLQRRPRGAARAPPTSPSLPLPEPRLRRLLRLLPERLLLLQPRGEIPSNPLCTSMNLASLVASVESGAPLLPPVLFAVALNLSALCQIRKSSANFFSSRARPRSTLTLRAAQICHDTAPSPVARHLRVQREELGSNPRERKAPFCCFLSPRAHGPTCHRRGCHLCFHPRARGCQRGQGPLGSDPG